MSTIDLHEEGQSGWVHMTLKDNWKMKEKSVKRGKEGKEFNGNSIKNIGIGIGIEGRRCEEVVNYKETTQKRIIFV